MGGAIVSSLEGVAIDGSINVDADSTYRRSGNITLVLDKRYNLIPAKHSILWLDKRCSILIGVDNYAGETVWFNLGRYGIKDIDISTTPDNKTVSLELSDYMSFLDGTLGGEISHQVLIPANEATISETIREVVKDIGNFSVENIGIRGSAELIPYDIEKPSGTSTYDLIKELVDLYKGYEFYFDKNGYFTVGKIKDRKNDAVIEFFDGRDGDYSIDIDSNRTFTNVKNSIHVWGEQLDNGFQVAEVYRNKFSRETLADMLQIDSKLLELGDICYVEDVDESYLYRGIAWYYLPFNVNPDFNMEKLGIKEKTINEPNIFTQEQAQLQAEHALKQHSHLAETITITTVPLYNLEVNNKIYVKTNEGIEGDYLITSLTIPFDISSRMTINAAKIYD